MPLIILPRLAAAFALAALACSIALAVPPAAPAPKLAEARAAAAALAAPVTLTFWQTHNAEETLTLKAALADFEKKYPQIKVKLDTVPFDDAQTKFKTAAKGGSAPDCFRAEIGWVAEMAELGYLQPADDYIGEADLADFLPAALKTATYKEELWGWPQVTDCLALLYNKRLLKEAGIAAPPATLPDLVAAARRLTDPAAKRYGFAFPSSDSYFLLPWIWSFGGGLVEEDGARTLRIGEPASVRGLQFVLDLRAKEKVVAPTFDIANDYTNQIEDFKAGRVAMFFMGPWATATLLEGAEFKGADGPDNLGVALLPRAEGAGAAAGNSPIGGHTLVISAACKQPELAAVLLDYLTQPEVQARFTEKNNLLPTRKSAYEVPAVKSNRLANAFAEQLKAARTRPILPEGAQLFPPLTAAYQQALRGEKTAAEALGQVAAEWQKVLKK